MLLVDCNDMVGEKDALSTPQKKKKNVKFAWLKGFSSI